MKVKAKKVTQFVEADIDSDAEIPPPMATKPKLKKKKATPTVTAVVEKKSKKLVSKKKSTKKVNDVADDHKASLDKLKDIDPEFYKYLEQNDKKLLKFNADVDDDDGDDDDEQEDEKNEESSDNDDEDDDEGGNEKAKGRKVHKPLMQLDVASDESDFEDEGNTVRKENTVTLKLLKQWQTELCAEKVSLDVIKNVVLALNSTLLSLAGETDPSAKVYQVEGAAAFNGVIQLCVLYLESAVRRFLGLHERTALKPHKCKKWNKVRSMLRGYIIDMTKLLEQVSSANILIVLLKHLHQFVPMISSFTSLAKPILKRLVSLWSTGEETVRVLSFLCILRITRDQQLTVLSTVLKAMYLSYVRNSKFVSPNTLPGINFMRRSLVEMFALDVNVSYQHVFLYIRQLAIHLRNAITLKKKESFQAVYNWQFINSLRLWSELLSAVQEKQQLQPLVYPLVSIITGTIKLIPTAQFFPLRFHCVQTLVQLSKETRTFVPVLPFVLEVLNSNTFNRKHTNVSMKPLNFSCLLRLNKKQLLENGFRDEAVEQIYSIILDYLAHESYSLAYPDLVVAPTLQLKRFLKDHNTKYNRKLKQLLDKIEENARFMNKERNSFTFDLKDASAIAAWEVKLRNKGTPLLTFYNNWVNTHINAQKRRTIDSENVDEYNLPKLLKRKAEYRPSNDGPTELFPSDDDDDELEIERAPKPKKAKKIATPKKSVTTDVLVQNGHDSDADSFADDTVDIVKDLDMDDW